jgi:hypothetical protein
MQARRRHRADHQRIAKPSTLACMHGSAWRGDGGPLLRRLADRFAPAAA